MELRELIARAVYADNPTAWWLPQPTDYKGIPPAVRRDLLQEAAAILAALDAAGLVVVPREMTKEMLADLHAAAFFNSSIGTKIGPTYTAMIAASPYAKNEVG